MERMTNKPHFTYANVVATLALFLALGGATAFAAGKIQSGDIAQNAVKSGNLAPGAVHTSNLFKRAVTSGKLAVGAVRGNQIADGVVGTKQIADGAVGGKQITDGAVGGKQIADSSIRSKQIGAAAVAPANLEFPVFYAASPRGGSAQITSGPDLYPVTDSTWAQNPGQIEVLFGAAAATIAYDENSGQGSCRVFFEVDLNGQQVGQGEVSTGSTTLQQVEQSVGAQPQVDPVAPVTNHLTVRTASNGGCTSNSVIDSVRFRVLDFG
jgi:hypothetical protein